MTSAVQRETNALAIVSLVFGILAWVALPLLGNIVAIICGHIARGQIAASQGRQEGAGLALAGLILGYLGILLGLMVILLLVFGIGMIAVLGSV